MAISTLMLAEIVGMASDPALAERAHSALGRAVDVIIKAQEVKKGIDHAGGWRYQPNSNDSDISVTGWQVMALRAAEECRLRRRLLIHRSSGRLSQTLRRQRRRLHLSTGPGPE